MLTYSSSDGLTVETVRVSLSGLAIRATGYIVSAKQPAFGASYSIVVDGEGRTRRITVRCDDASGARSLSLTRSPGGPWVAESAAGSAPMQQLGEAVDVYIADSGFSASLPVRRLGLHTQVGAEAEVTVARINLPDLSVVPDTQHGRIESVTDTETLIAYSGADGKRTVAVDTDGLLVRSDGHISRVS